MNVDSPSQGIWTSFASAVEGDQRELRTTCVTSAVSAPELPVIERAVSAGL